MSAPEARYHCGECGALVTETELLHAPNPFDPGDTITGCPHCRLVPTFDRLCDHGGCREVGG